MAFQYANVLAFMAIGIGFLLGGLLFGSLIRPNIPDPEKSTIYECGERPIGPAWFRFNPRFYLIALVFVIFDVEVAFMFPVVSVFKSWVTSGHGMVAFFEVLAFVGILSVGLAYVWSQGDLAWIKRLAEDRDAARAREGVTDADEDRTREARRVA